MHLSLTYPVQHATYWSDDDAKLVVREYACAVFYDSLDTIGAGVHFLVRILHLLDKNIA